MGHYRGLWGDAAPAKTDLAESCLSSHGRKSCLHVVLARLHRTRRVPRMIPVRWIPENGSHMGAKWPAGYETTQFLREQDILVVIPRKWGEFSVSAFIHSGYDA